MSRFFASGGQSIGVSVSPSVLPVNIRLEKRTYSILKEISPEYLLEGLMVKLKLQYFGHKMGRDDSLEKTPNAGKD